MNRNRLTSRQMRRVREARACGGLIATLCVTLDGLAAAAFVATPATAANFADVCFVLASLGAFATLAGVAGLYMLLAPRSWVAQ